MTAPQTIDVIQARMADSGFVQNAHAASVQAAIEVKGETVTDEASSDRSSFADVVLANPDGFTVKFAYLAAALSPSTSTDDIAATIYANFGDLAGVQNAATKSRSELAQDSVFQARVMQAAADAATAYLATTPPTLGGPVTQDMVDADAVERVFAAKVSAGAFQAPQYRVQFAENVLSDPAIIALDDPSQVTDEQIAQAVHDGAVGYIAVQAFEKAHGLPAT